jgi:hypothetical protein
MSETADTPLLNVLEKRSLFGGDCPFGLVYFYVGILIVLTIVGGSSVGIYRDIYSKTYNGTSGCPFSKPDCLNYEKLECYNGQIMGCFKIWVIADAILIFVIVIIGGPLAKMRDTREKEAIFAREKELKSKGYEV